MAKKPEPTFEVRFVAPGLVPENLPLHAVTEVLAAVQDLASGRDPFETRQVPQEKTIGLLNVRRGSAIYGCVSRAPDEARHNLRLVGEMLADLDKAAPKDDLMVSAFRPVELMSLVAKKNHCRLEVYAPGKRDTPMFVISGQDFEKLSGRLLLTGETTVIGTVVRAGGATGMRCLMRVPGRQRILYCDVETKKLVRQLGRHLYEPIAATGKATWIHRSWYIYKFTVSGFTQPRLGDPAKAIAKLRSAGLNAWDNIPNPDAYSKEAGL
jgi:hypothetical protein